MSVEDIARLDERVGALGRLTAEQFAARDEALRINTLNFERRLEGMNELRAQITEERVHYLTREVYDTAHTQIVEQLREVEARTVSSQAYDAMNERVGALERFFSSEQGRGLGTAATTQRLFAGAGTLIAVIAIVVTIVLSHG